MPEENVAPSPVIPTPEPTVPPVVPPTTPVSPTPKKSSKMMVWVLLVLLVLAALGVGGYFLMANKSSEQPSSRTAVTATPTTTVTSNPTASSSTAVTYQSGTKVGWKKYQNQKSIKFSFEIPEAWYVDEVPEPWYAEEKGSTDLLVIILPYSYLTDAQKQKLIYSEEGNRRFVSIDIIPESKVRFIKTITSPTVYTGCEGDKYQEQTLNIGNLIVTQHTNNIKTSACFTRIYTVIKQNNYYLIFDNGNNVEVSIPEIYNEIIKSLKFN